MELAETRRLDEGQMHAAGRVFDHLQLSPRARLYALLLGDTLAEGRFPSRHRDHPPGRRNCHGVRAGGGRMRAS
jgi:hypothetical protein